MLGELKENRRYCRFNISKYLIMDRIDDLPGLQAFERIVALGSLTAAASELGLSLAVVSKQSEELGTVAHMDVPMLLLTFAMSVLAALLAGLLPTWRACQVTPAIQLKSQ